jgi:hypothetical protein
VRGDVEAARDMAELFLREIESEPDQPEACVGHRIFGATSWYAGDFAVARRHLEESLSLSDHGVHGDFANRFGQDVAVTAQVFLALALWPLGEIEAAHRLAEEMVVRAINSGHVATMAYGHCHKAIFGATGRNAAAYAVLAPALEGFLPMPEFPEVDEAKRLLAM